MPSIRDAIGKGDPTQSLHLVESYENDLAALFKQFGDKARAAIPVRKQYQLMRKEQEGNTPPDLAHYLDLLQAAGKSLIDQAKPLVGMHVGAAYTHGVNFGNTALALANGEQPPVEPAPVRMSSQAARVIKNLQASNMQYITKTTVEQQTQIAQALQHGVTGNLTYRAVAKEIDGILDDGIVRAKMIARTETMRALNAAAKDRYNGAGIERVQWLAAADERECPDCADLDGQEFDIDEAPDCPLHPSCRCCLAPVVDSVNGSADMEFPGLFRDLGGFDEPLKIRHVRDLPFVEDVYSNARACPFPYSKDRPLPGDILKGKVSNQEVRLDSLWATQYAVGKKRVKLILKDIEDGKYEGDLAHVDHITVIHHNGRHLIQDGHHHATALWLHGEKEAYAVHVLEMPDNKPGKEHEAGCTCGKCCK